MSRFVALVCLLLLVFLSNTEGRNLQPISSHLLKNKNYFSSKKSGQYRHPKDLQSCLELRGGEKLDWRYFFAGSVCAAFSHGVTTPIDVIKTKMQTNPERFNQGLLHAAKDIIKNEGFTFLLAGLGPTVVGYGLEGALKFGFYETFKKIFHSTTPYKIINSLLASVVAGAIASIVLVPMEDARIKMVGDASWSKENVATAIARLLRENGLFATFSGLTAMLAKQVPYTMGKNVSFDFIKNYFLAIAALFPTLEDRLGHVQLKWVITVLSAFFTSIVACVLSQPGDMILTASCGGSGHGGHSSHDHSSGKKLSFGQAVQQIYAKHGVKGFYFGVQARLAHVASIITVQLVVYDILNTMLGVQSSH